jgi:hypothetical protein
MYSSSRIPVVGPGNILLPLPGRLIEARRNLLPRRVSFFYLTDRKKTPPRKAASQFLRNAGLLRPGRPEAANPFLQRLLQRKHDPHETPIFRKSLDIGSPPFARLNMAVSLS